MLRQFLIFSSLLVAGCSGPDFSAVDEGYVEMFKDTGSFQDAGAESSSVDAGEEIPLPVDASEETEKPSSDAALDSGYPGLLFENGAGDLCFDKPAYCYNKCAKDSDCCQGGFCPLGIPRICVEVPNVPLAAGQKYCMPSCAILVYKDTAYTTATFCIGTVGPLKAVCQPSPDGRPACLP